MPQAAAHILIPLLIMSIIRDFYIKKIDKRSFPLHYVLIAGIAGAIPDLDILAYWILYFFGVPFSEVHRTFAHALFVPLLFLVIGLIVHNQKIPALGKHKLKLNIILYMIALGSFSHLIIDGIFQNTIMPFYPFSTWAIGINLFGFLPKGLQYLAAPSLDAALIIIYLIYLEAKHKISDFI